MPSRHIIIHEVSKEPPRLVTKKLRDQENPQNAHAERVTSQLTSLFKGVSIGAFRPPKHQGLPLTPFESLLRNAFDGTDFDDFVGFSHGVAAVLVDELSKPSAQQAKTGYLLLNHYEHQGSSFLSVVLLRMRQGISLAEDLSFTEVDELNLDTLHMAARINLTAWRRADGDRYIAFKIGTKAREVTQYFQDFIGCQEYTVARIDTRNLVAATKRFCERRNLVGAQEIGVRRTVMELALERMEMEQPILLEDVSALLDLRYPPDAEEDRGLMLEIAQQEFALTNSLPTVEKRALRSLVRYAGRTDRLSISFEADLVEEGIVSFDPRTKYLTIKQLPESLLAELDPASQLKREDGTEPAPR